jgi:hypothetical protein
MNRPDQAQRLGSHLLAQAARWRSHMQQTGTTDVNAAAAAVAAEDYSTAAANELLAYAAQLQPQHVQYLQALDASGGGEAVIRALMAIGLGRGALELVADLYDNHGGMQGVVQTVQNGLAEVAEQNRAASIEQGIAGSKPLEGDSGALAAVKAKSPFFAWARNPDVQKQAAEFCAKAGIPIEPGIGPFESFVRFARGLADGTFVNEHRKPFEAKVEPAEAIAALAEMVGEKPEELAGVLRQLDGAGMHHDLTVRLAKKDHAPERRQAVPSIDARGKAQVAAERSRRSAIEKAYTAAEARENERARPARQERPKPPQQQTDTRSATEKRRDALDKGFDALERGETPPRDTTPEPVGGLRAALEQGYDDLSHTGEEGGAA